MWLPNGGGKKGIPRKRAVNTAGGWLRGPTGVAGEGRRGFCGKPAYKTRESQVGIGGGLFDACHSSVLGAFAHTRQRVPVRSPHVSARRLPPPIPPPPPFRPATRP